MGKKGWAKFWFRDYENDMDVSMCSLAAQGLWMRMLCRMHEGEPYGYLTIHGRPIPLSEFKQVFRCFSEDFEILLQELKDKRVFEVTEEGVIYCRRMVRQFSKAQTYRENGRKGGNPRLKKGQNEQPKKLAEDAEIRLTKGLSKRASKNSPSRSSRIIDSSLRSESISPDQQFEVFWKAYAKRSASKRNAATQFAKALRLAPFETIIAAVERYVLAQPDPQFRKDPERWLRAEMWTAEFDPAPALALGTASGTVSGKDAFLAKLGSGTLDNSEKTHPDVGGPVIDGQAEETDHVAHYEAVGN